MKKEKQFALIRMGAALVAAIVLLAVTGFGFIPMLAGPAAISDGEELAGQSYVSADLEYMMTLCGEEVRGEDVVAYYAIAPIGNRFVVLRFDAALQSDIETMTEATTAYLGGESRVMTVHMPIKGMVETAETAVYDLLSQWFEANKDWMAAAGVVGAEPTAEEYLAAELVRVDDLGSMSGERTLLLSVLALLLVVYALVELVFMLAGGQKAEKPGKTEKPAKPAKAEAAAPEPATAEPAAEENAEAAGEEAQEAKETDEAAGESEEPDDEEAVEEAEAAYEAEEIDEAEEDEAAEDADEEEQDADA